jgi:hypothetical protein
MFILFVTIYLFRPDSAQFFIFFGKRCFFKSWKVTEHGKNN